ncbi:MAG: hypothetical protein EON96_07550, partial [Caulobacteraceae bacterium]
MHGPPHRRRYGIQCVLVPARRPGDHGPHRSPAAGTGQRPLNSTPPRVGILLHDLRGGGAEGVMLKLARGLLDRGYAVDILLVRSGGVLAALIPEQAAVFELNRTRVATAIPKLARYLRDHRPDWLISALTHVNLAAILARLVSGTGVRLIVTEHTQISRRARTAATLSARLTYALTPVLYR